jgi:hypothetical protein
MSIDTITAPVTAEDRATATSLAQRLVAKLETVDEALDLLETTVAALKETRHEDMPKLHILMLATAHAALDRLDVAASV